MDNKIQKVKLVTRIGVGILLCAFLLVACQVDEDTPQISASNFPETVESPVNTEIAVMTPTEVPQIIEPTITPSAMMTPTATPLPPEWPVAGMEIGQIEDLSMLGDLGTYWVRRNGLKWFLVEPVPGARLWGEVTVLEEELKQISNMGMQAILIVRGAPDWAQSIPGKPCAPIKPESLQAFAEFLRDAVKRYSQPPYQVKYWELGNEPDVDPSILSGTGPFGCWGDLSDLNYYGGGNYAQMLKVAYPVIKEEDPNAQVLIGGLLLDCDPVHPPETSPGSGQLRYCTPSRYLEGILENGGGDYFDGVSFHAYDYYKGAEGQFGNGNWYSAWNTTGPVISAKVNYLRSVLAAYGHSEKYLMNTENALLCGRDGREPDCLAEVFNLTKMYYVVQSGVMALAEGLRANIWYDLRGWRGTAMVDASLQPLPAYVAYQFNIRMLSGMTYWGRIQGLDRISGYEFRQGERVVWVLWSLDGSVQELNLPASTTAIYDVLGQLQLIEQKVDITIAPVYIEWIAEH